jgi:cysteinyl-tRNA synthetase
MKFPTFFAKKKPELPPLRFHNTLSGKTETFLPLNHTVRMYSCGPTAYDQQHIGNLFPPVVANVVHRTLNVWGYKVKEVINITDFGHISEDEASEDKMTKGLRREKKALTLKNMRALAEKYAHLFFEDLPPLGINPERIKFPRASDYIKEQVALVQALEEKGYAYRVSDGVYFDVSRFAEYGKLGGTNLAGQLAGARIEENKEKHSPYDFALWKLNKKLGWESPWGKGFPGWHTECVAMIFTLLGRQIDIHMGGIDLVPIHHNNEIAQAEALTGKQYVRYWLHNAHITIEGKKVSKSLGNTIYLHNLVDRGLSARALRYWFLTGHYRTPMNFTWDAIEGANTALNRLSRIFLELGQHGSTFAQGSTRSNLVGNTFVQSFYEAIANDLNTAQALALIWGMVKDDSISPAQKRAWLLEADQILGLGLDEHGPTNKLAVIAANELPEEVQQLVEQREKTRLSKDFAKADELRDKIGELGFEIEDSTGGPKITKKA